MNIRFSPVFIFFIILFNPLFTRAQENIPIGTWRNHLSHRIANSVATSNQRVFCATENGLFFLDRDDNRLATLSKIDGLSGVTVSTIGYNDQLNILVVAYTDGNIDFIKDQEIVNFDVIKKARLDGSKKINHISFRGDFAYLSADFGMSVINLTDIDIDESFLNLGENGEKLIIFSSSFRNDSIFLATDAGIIAGKIAGNINLQDFRNWRRFDEKDGIPKIPIKSIASTQNEVFAGVDSIGLFKYAGNSWSNVTIANIEFNSIDSTNNSILVTSNTSVSQLIDNELVPLDISLANRPSQAITGLDGTIWIADKANGLVGNPEGDFVSFFPSGPFSNQIFKLASKNGMIIGVRGGYDEFVNPGGVPAGFYVFENGNWTNFSAGSEIKTIGLPQLKDLVDISFNSATNDIHFASYGGGILTWKDRQSFEIIDDTSPGSTLFNSSSLDSLILISAIAPGEEGNLWVANHGAPEPLHLFDPPEQWTSFSFVQNASRLPLGLLITEDGDKWARINPNRGGGILVFNEAIGQNRILTTTPGQGDLPSNIINDFTIDQDGQIWLATSEGIAFFGNPFNILSQGVVDVNIPIFENRLLFSGQEITAIAIDGGNRKWIGTNEGIWLFSETGDEMVFHFTEENSPLLSNNIVDIAVEDVSGEVFIATDKGILSFRGTATTAGPVHENVKVFPNPIPANFNGLVGISGLANNVIVKITDISGQLVKEMRSHGGTATWNVRDYQGKRAQTGVYLIFSSTPDGQETFIGKLAVIN